MNKKPTVIIINGKPRAGKDKFCKYAAECVGNGLVENISSIDVVKHFAYMFGWDGTKSSENRKMLSDFKDFLTRYFDLPFKYITDNIKLDRKSKFIFVHVREPNEIKKLRNWCLENSYECITLFIKRDNNEYISNHADRNVENYIYDLYVSNNKSLDEYKILVYDLMEMLKEGMDKILVE